MKVQNPVASGKASGRALGGVFSFNRGMGTFKKYVKTFRPNTEGQQIITTKFSYLTKFWKTELTYEEITLWNNWNLPWVDIYGDTVLLTGLNKFVICNSLLLEAEKDLTRIPPTETPSGLSITETTDPMWIKLIVDGIAAAEITAQEPFLRIQTCGTPSRVEYIDGQLGIYWDGMPISRKPLEKNWKTIFFYDCRSGFEGVEELKIIIQTENYLRGLQPIRIQRFNKWGYWSGKETYINPITAKSIFLNSDFYTTDDWTITDGASISNGKLIFHDYSAAHNYKNFISGHTYRFMITIEELEAGGTLNFKLNGSTFWTETTTGIKEKEYLMPADKTDFHLSWAEYKDAKFDDVYCEDLGII